MSCDGLNIFDTIRVSREADSYCRSNRAPVFLHMKTVRLMGHAGSDIELSYLDESQIKSAEKKDPLLLSALSIILETRWLPIKPAPPVIKYLI